MTVVCDIRSASYETVLNTIIKNADSADLKHKVTEGGYNTLIELTSEGLPQPICINLHKTGSCLHASYKEKPKSSIRGKLQNVAHALHNLRKPFVYQDIEHPDTYLSLEEEKFLNHMKKVLDGLERNHLTTIWGGGD